MRPRYLALIGAGAVEQGDIDGDRIEETMRAAGLAAVINSDRLTLLANEAATPIRLGGEGALLGTVFRSGDGGRLRALDETARENIRATAGAWLLQNAWGSYVAFLDCRGVDEIHVVRDPSEGLACYYLRYRRSTVVASDIELLLTSGLIEPRIHWEGIRRYMLAIGLRGANTCLTGLTELLRGFRLGVDPHGKWRLDQLWSPWRFADRDRLIRDEAEATASVRETALMCVGSWASCFDHVLLALSGGLDSSIVAACLARSKASFSCYTLATRNPIGDERDYARQVAQALGAPLFEAPTETDRIQIARAATDPLSPRPIAGVFARANRQISLGFANQAGATALFDGEGGDAVFCYLLSAAVITDRLLIDGPGFGALRTAKDLSLLTGASIFKATRMAIRRGWLRERGYRWPVNRALLAPAATESLTEVARHPWLEAPPDALPGKAVHIAQILNVGNVREGPGDASLQEVSPLLSQPLIELCLRIPSWQWCEGGHNRTVARRAFKADLPAAILARRSKGRSEGFVLETYDANRSRIKEMLMEGLLNQQNLLDRDAVARTLSAPQPPQGLLLQRIIDLTAIEMWAQYWSTRRGKSPGAG